MPGTGFEEGTVARGEKGSPATPKPVQKRYRAEDFETKDAKEINRRLQVRVRGAGEVEATKCSDSSVLHS